MEGHSSEVEPRAAERLFVAVVNQAILDLLERRVSTTLRQVLTKFSEFSFSTKKFRARTA